MSFVLAVAASVAAQDPQPQATPEPSPSPPAAPQKVQVTGFVDVYYEYNFNHVDPTARTFDVQHNTFSLSLAEVAFAKVPTAESRLGFRADFDFGKTAEIVASFEPKDTDRQLYQYVQQAYISVLAGSKVQLDAGKFVTPAGAEVIESQDNWNYTRSMLFGYAIPFYHLGVRATVPVNDKLSVAALVANGWNNSSQINGGLPCLGLGVTAKPTAKLTWVANYMAGQELPGESAPTRHLVDSTLTVAATSKLSLMANADYGKEGEVQWWGVAAYAKLQVLPSWALAARYEYVDDTRGAFMTFGTRVQEVTLTSDHTIAGALKARLEYRTDFAAKDIFQTDSGSHRGSQTTLAVGLVCSFSGGI